MNCFEYSTENQEKEDKPKEEEAKEQVVEEKAKAKSSQPKEASPAFMSSIFAFLDVYRNKMLVSPHITYTYSLNISFFFFTIVLFSTENCFQNVDTQLQSSQW